MKTILILLVALLSAGCVASVEFGSDGSRKVRVEVTDGKAVLKALE